jgi:hypothetical protein
VAPWRRHRALELLLETHPELEGDEPPALTVLAAALERTELGFTLAGQTEAKTGYEAAVVRGRIPTRERSWHDTFNVLAFARFPQAKAALHRRCLMLQQERAGKPPRSREEDALTLIDETALVFAGSVDAIATLDRVRAGRVLADIDEVVRAHGIIGFAFGHALLEHLVLERPPIGAGVLTIPLAHAVDREQTDRALAERITAGGFPRPQLQPVLPWPDPIVESWLT